MQFSKRNLLKSGAASIALTVATLASGTALAEDFVAMLLPENVNPRWESQDAHFFIPANPARDVPGAGALGIAEFLGHKAVSNPGFRDQARALLAEVSDPAETVTADSVRHLEVALPEAFEALLRWTYMGYYSRPDIRPLFGLSPLPTQPRGYEVPPESPEEMAALVGPVKSRGRCYRTA